MILLLPAMAQGEASVRLQRNLTHVPSVGDLYCVAVVGQFAYQTREAYALRSHEPIPIS